MKTLVAGSIRMIELIILVLLLGAVVGCASSAQVLTVNLSEPLNGAKTAKVDINTRTDNVTIDKLTGDEQVLASGTLQYVASQEQPSWSVRTENNQSTLTLRSGVISNKATQWQVHLNPTVVSEITLRSGGGNMKLNLAGMAVTRVMADIGGGNLDVILPDTTANLGVTAKSGAGNVTVEFGSDIKGMSIVNANSGAGNVVVRVPSGIAAKIHATGGLGTVTVDSHFSKLDSNTYQSSDYESATNKVEITVNSGAGNVSVSTK